MITSLIRVKEILAIPGDFKMARSGFNLATEIHVPTLKIEAKVKFDFK